MLLVCPYCLKSNCQGLGRKNKHEILKTDRMATYNTLLHYLHEEFTRLARDEAGSNTLNYIKLALITLTNKTIEAISRELKAI